MAKSNLPNFLFIGPDKSGSTWLYEVLRRHPECFIPRVKDIYFFDRYYGRGLDWYARLFAGAPPDAKAVGELSHDYLFSPQAARRIERDLPGVRLITFLRDPVDRCFSEYLFLLRSGLTAKSFDDALRQFPEVVEHSRYALHLRTYVEIFGFDRLGVFFFDDLVADPERLARRVFEFLGLPWIDGIDVASNPLPAARPRNALVARLARDGAQVARRVRAQDLVARVKESAFARRLYVPYAAAERPRIEAATREHLARLFEADTRELARLLPNVELPIWAKSGVGRPN